MKRTLLIIMLLLAPMTVVGQIPVEVKNLMRHHAPLPPTRFRKAFPAAWPCTIVGYPSLPYGEEKITLTSVDSGKTWKSIGSLCVSDFTTYQLVTAALPKHAHAQQPKPDVKPVTLNADASAMWQRIDAAEDNLRQQFQVLESQRQALLIGANVPKEFWPQCGATDKIVTCAPPKVAEKKP